MRTLKTSLSIVSLLFALRPITQAKTSFAYVANNSAGTVSVVNTANNMVVTTIPVGSFPYAVAVNQAGTFAYITNSGSGTVSVISTSTNTVVATITVGGSPLNMALSPSGKAAYVSTGGSVAAINTGTKKVTASIPVSNPIGLAVTPNGAFLICRGFVGGKSVGDFDFDERCGCHDPGGHKYSDCGGDFAGWVHRLCN